MKRTKIRLGDKVRCKNSGFEGVAVCRTEFINGCIQFNVIPKAKEGAQVMPEEIGIDEGSLEIVWPEKVKVEKKQTGGPMNRSIRFRGC